MGLTAAVPLAQKAEGAALWCPGFTWQELNPTDDSADTQTQQRGAEALGLSGLERGFSCSFC